MGQLFLNYYHIFRLITAGGVYFIPRGKQTERWDAAGGPLYHSQSPLYHSQSLLYVARARGKRTRFTAHYT